MTCHRVRKLIPLSTGDDLRPRLARAVRAHIDACPACRRELEEFQEAMAGLKAAAKEEGVPDWSEGEWKTIMARVTVIALEARGQKGSFHTRRLWPRWAAASALGVGIGLALLSVIFRDRIPTKQEIAEVAEPDVVSLTMVSQETGLQIVWFLDKNFDWKGVQE